MAAMADQAEMKLLHMFVAADPNRNASFAFFGDPNYFLTDFPSSTCTTCINPAFAWNHGDIQPEIANTWLGFVGPGIRPLGEDGAVWTDHTDVRPTMLTLLGLSDDYTPDGRAIAEILQPSWVPSQLAAHRATLLRLGAAYKQLDAPFGALGMASLRYASAAVAGGSSTDDSAYLTADATIAGWMAQRDAIAGQISALLAGAEFGGTALDENHAKDLIDQAWALIDSVEATAG